MLRQRTVLFIDAGLNGGLTTMISAGEVHLPGCPTDKPRVGPDQSTAPDRLPGARAEGALPRSEAIPAIANRDASAANGSRPAPGLRPQPVARQELPRAALDARQDRRDIGIGRWRQLVELGPGGRGRPPSKTGEWKCTLRLAAPSARLYKTPALPPSYTSRASDMVGPAPTSVKQRGLDVGGIGGSRADPCVSDPSVIIPTVRAPSCQGGPMELDARLRIDDENPQYDDDDEDEDEVEDGDDEITDSDIEDDDLGDDDDEDEDDDLDEDDLEDDDDDDEEEDED
jgi:hypothetical protein